MNRFRPLRSSLLSPCSNLTVFPFSPILSSSSPRPLFPLPFFSPFIFFFLRLIIINCQVVSRSLTCPRLSRLQIHYLHLLRFKQSHSRPTLPARRRPCSTVLIGTWWVCFCCWYGLSMPEYKYKIQNTVTITNTHTGTDEPKARAIVYLRVIPGREADHDGGADAASLGAYSS